MSYIVQTGAEKQEGEEEVAKRQEHEMGTESIFSCMLEVAPRTSIYFFLCKDSFMTWIWTGRG